ncbi:MAG: UDP-N-acetyl-D-glucosamine dehydrogenase, partial [Thermoplasmata archaeon]|nr:UDP-N-acetyl-D-glucosamine dehydrogenase [Thermoplasmata archaeon]
MAAPAEKVAILGLGYVGLPLAARMARAFPTVGFDPDKAKVARLRAGEPVAGFEARQYRVQGLTFSDDEAALAGCTTFIICVPTPLAHDGDPDLGAIRSAGRTTSRFLKKGGLVILESTTYPGTTDEVLLPIL